LRNLYLNFALGELRMGRGVFAELLAFSPALGLARHRRHRRMRRGIFAELLALLVTVDIVAVASYSTYYKELPPWSPLGWASKQLKR
jgi:hypothetical protein